MANSIQSQHYDQHLSFDICDLNNESPLSAKLEIQWNNNLCTKLQALNEELPSLGLRQFLRKSDSCVPIIDLNCLTSAFYSLFERHLHSLNSRGGIDEAICRIKAELEYSRTMHERCKEELQSVQSSLNQSRERERRTESEKTALSNQIRNLKGSIRRQQSDFQTRNTQFQHEIQKLRKENYALKTRFNSILQKPMSSSRRPPIPSQRSTENAKSMLDLTRCMVDHLRTRENDLFHENRELRDLVSVLSSRMLRFSQHLHDRRLGLINDQEDSGRFQDLETEETSLDGSSEAENAENSDESSYEDNLREDSSQRRKSANVHHLLLEMPFYMVRNRLTCRVHRLSRRLWNEIKALLHIRNDDQSIVDNDLQIRRGLEEELNGCKLRLAQCEEELAKRNDILSELGSLAVSGDMGSTQGENEIDQSESTSTECRTPCKQSPNKGEGGYRIKAIFTPTSRRIGK
ncbi:unnamed protein product [Hymenolepis diminuta]|uniref:Uncharacterized protein n=1 Tax=Hymenolepis diminuta TaxID=6216 RepID=A0A564Y7R2_HYMDI|nr:unnamed protein product [Hymenolepis diminuta]